VARLAHARRLHVASIPAGRAAASLRRPNSWCERAPERDGPRDARRRYDAIDTPATLAGL